MRSTGAPPRRRPTGQLELDLAAADVLKAKADVAAAEALVSKCSVAAPFDGVTAEQKVRPFEYAMPGRPLLEVFDDHAFEVEWTVPSRWLTWLKPGTPFQVKIRGNRKILSGEAYEARRPD